MIWPKSFQLVSLLKLSQFLLHAVEEVCSLKSTAAAVQPHDYDVEGADQNRGPVHLKLLRHHLTTGGAVPITGSTCDRYHNTFTAVSYAFKYLLQTYCLNVRENCQGHISPQNKSKRKETRRKKWYRKNESQLTWIHIHVERERVREKELGGAEGK